MSKGEGNIHEKNKTKLKMLKHKMIMICDSKVKFTLTQTSISDQGDMLHFLSYKLKYILKEDI